MPTKTYPLALAALKTTATLLALNIDQTDLTIEQRLNLLGTAVGEAQTAYNQDQEADKVQIDLIIDELQAVGNDLKAKIDAIDFADADTVQTLSENLTAIKTLIEGDAGVTIINTLDTIADELNSMHRTKPFVAVIDLATGKKTVDISSLGLADITSYSCQATMIMGATFNHARVGVRKVDKDTVEVIAFDAAYTPETAKGVSTPLTVNVEVTYLPIAPISLTLTETDGDTATVGN